MSGVTATYTVEIAWTSPVFGGFIVGTSKVGDTIGYFTVTGWVDETERVLNMKINRGSTDDLGKVINGSCTIVLKDTNGRFNPTNTASALYPNVNPMRPVRVKATYGATDYYRFFGYVQSITENPSPSKRSVSIRCTDLISWLSTEYPVVAANGTATTTGTAIERILDTIGFTDASFRDLDTGDTIADYSADGTQSALTQIQNLVAAEGGTFYISRAGAATFENRYARNQAPRTSDQSTLSGTMLDLTAMSDVIQIINSTKYTRTGGTAQTFTDDTSRQRYGKRIKPMSSSFWVNDAQALSAGTFFVGMKKNPAQPVRVSISGNVSAALMVVLLARDISDRLGISESRGGTTGSFYIESISETIETGKFHSAELYCSMRPASFPTNY